MARKKLTSATRGPLRGCEFCKGTGWVQETTAPPAFTRDVVGMSKNVPPPRTPVRRCPCTNMAIDQGQAPEPEKPAGLDQAQRAAGEKEEA